ncbi:sensor histidine kinase [Chloroflexota bacterium]
MARRTLVISYLASYLLAISAIIRLLVRFRDDRFLTIAFLAGGYLVLLIAEPFLIRQKRYSTYIYLLSQAAIICTLGFIASIVDYWAMLFCPIVVQVMNNFRRRIGFLITGAFSVTTAILLLSGLGTQVGLPLIFVYAVILFLLASYIAIIREAEAARDESEKRQVELLKTQEALRQSELEKAITTERSRLARELHDSVTQSLHSSTLMAEAGQRLAGSGDIERARGYLVRLGEISQQALKEMRLLVYELRPLALSGVGLVGALQQRLDAVERRSGVDVQLSIDEALELPASIEEELFRIAMEALNNVLKHANPTSVTVALHKDEKRATPCIELSIVDDGIGFDPDSKDDEGGLGLISMGERIEKLGGELTILSAPGEGTQVKACVDLNTSQSSPKAQEV